MMHIKCIKDALRSILNLKKKEKKYWNLFKMKYSHYNNYLEYFEAIYMDEPLNKWHYFDVLPNTFLTNNISESLNAMIKRDWTNRERKPLHLFFNTLKEGIIQLSKERKSFKKDVIFPTEVKIKGSQLEEKKIFLKFKDYYFLNKNEEGKVEVEKAKKFLDLTYNNLDDFKSDVTSLVVLNWNNTSKESICYCTRGFKYGVCHHKVALEIHLKIQNKIVLIIPAKKRGRKRKSPSSLQKEEEEIIQEIGKRVKKSRPEKMPKE